MALKGDLASVDLAQVFQMLVLNQKVGVLSIQGPRAWKALYFDGRGTTLYFNEHVLLDRVLQQMTQMGRIAKESVQEARDHSAQFGGGLVDALLAGGYLTEGDLSSALSTEIEEEIYDLFFWRDATFEFFEGATSLEDREGTVDDRFFFNTDSMVMEAARRIDEWSYIQDRVPGALEVYRARIDDPRMLDIDDFAVPLIDLLDGKRNVSRLTEVTGMPSFQVYKALALMLDQGVLEPVPADALVDTARECVDEGRHPDAINLYEKAIAEEYGVPDSNAEVADVYETVGEYELACYHHKCVAEFNAAEDDIKHAVARLRRVVDMLPTDLAARERLVELTVGRAGLADDGFDPTSLGKELVDLYLEIGEIDRVRGILERLLRDNPYDIELKKSLINVHTRAGDTKRVIELYESIADDLVQQRKPIEAVKFLQKILMLDRGRRDISECIRSLYEMDERRRSRRRSLAALGALFVVLCALGVVWWFYEQHARERMGALERQIAQLLEQKDYEQAESRVRGFIKQFPLTIVSRRAEAELARIESERENHEASITNQRRARDKELEKYRQAYKLAWHVFKSHIEQKQLDAALSQIVKVEELVNKAGEPKDFYWAQSVKLEKEKRYLENYISQALGLDRQAWAKFEAGEWRAARKLWLELIAKYRLAKTAIAARVPVRLISNPAGATVYYSGQPLVDKATKQPKVTPALVLVPHGRIEKFELRRKGFVPMPLEVDALEDETVQRVLTALPLRRFAFPNEVQTTPTIAGGNLSVGLREGKVAIARIETGKARTIIQLDDLDEMEGQAALTPDRVYFRTKQGFLHAHSLVGGELRWRERLRYDPVSDPVHRNGRVFIADARGRLLAHDAMDGRSLWKRPLGSVIVQEPQVYGRFVLVGLQQGGVRMLDAQNGEVVISHDVSGNLAAAPLYYNGLIVYATENGQVVAINDQSGRQKWSDIVGRFPENARIVRKNEALLVPDGNRALKLLGIADGKVYGRVELPGRVIGGPIVGEDLAFVTIRQTKARGDEDAMLVVSLRNLEVQWEYRDGGKFAASVATDGDRPFLPTSKGELVQFQ